MLYRMISSVLYQEHNNDQMLQVHKYTIVILAAHLVLNVDI